MQNQLTDFLVVTCMANGGEVKCMNATAGANAPVGSIQCKSILVVEDDETIRETLKLALELDGHKVFTAANGKEGIDLLRSIPKPCLILLDLMMPVMNGWEFIEAIERDHTLATIPVVVVTAYSDRARTIRAKGVIKKPLDLDVLSKIVKQWCGP